MTRPVDPPPIPAVVLLARDAWRLGLAAIRGMPVLFGSTFALLLAFELAFLGQHPPVPGQAGTAALLWGLANDIATDVLGASAFVGVHRAILLGEAADRPAWRLPPGYDGYVLWLVGLNLPLLPFAVMDAMAGPGYSLQSVVALLLALVGGVAVTLRLALLLPLHATEALVADPGTVWDATRGTAWRLLAAVLLTFVPMEAGAALLAGLFRGLGGAEAVVLAALGDAGKAVLWGAVGAALWSRLLQTYGGALAQPPVWR